MLGVVEVLDGVGVDICQAGHLPSTAPPLLLLPSEDQGQGAPLGGDIGHVQADMPFDMEYVVAPMNIKMCFKVVAFYQEIFAKLAKC